MTNKYLSDAEERKLRARVRTLLAHEYVANLDGSCQVCYGRPDSISHFRRDAEGRYVIPIRDQDSTTGGSANG